MIKIGEVYYDTVLETLFIVDAVSSTRVYLLELKEKVDPRVVIEKPETIFKRYKLTNIGRDILDNESRSLTNFACVEHLADLGNNAKPPIGDMLVGSFGPENKNIAPYTVTVKDSPISKSSKVVVKPKAKPGRRIVKKVTKKLIKKPNKK